MPTERKIEANRRNAQLSTGPRTEDGKTVSSMNALKHGLTASAPLLPGESREEYQAFVDGIVSELEPVTVLQSSMALNIATKLWRLRRVAKVEAEAVGSKFQPGAWERLSLDEDDQREGVGIAFTRAFNLSRLERIHAYENHLETGLYRSMAAYAATKRATDAEPV